MVNKLDILSKYLILSLVFCCLPVFCFDGPRFTSHFKKSLWKSGWIAGLAVTLPTLTTWSIPSTATDLGVSSSDRSFGVIDGRLLACARRSNCISTSSINLFEKYSRPWQFIESPDDIYSRLKGILAEDPYLKLVETDDQRHYLHAEAKSAVPPSGIDDVEFLIKDADRLVTYRSNSREIIGFGDEILSDAGSNRNRLQSVQKKLGLSEMNVDDGIDSYVKEVQERNFFQLLQKASEPSEVNFLD